MDYLQCMGQLDKPAGTAPATGVPMATTNATPDELRALYDAWHAADAEFSAALRAAFGKDAGDVRYQPTKYTPEVKAAAEKFMAAGAAYWAARKGEA